MHMDLLENSDKETCDRLRKLFQSDPSALIRKFRRKKGRGKLRQGMSYFGIHMMSSLELKSSLLTHLEEQ